MAVVTFEQEASSRTVRWQSLRLLLVQLLYEAGRPMTIPELIEACEAEGVIFTSRPSKLISDTLRWETRKRRVVRVARGRYRYGFMPRSTIWWLGQKMAALRERLRQLRAAERTESAQGAESGQRLDRGPHPDSAELLTPTASLNSNERPSQPPP